MFEYKSKRTIRVSRDPADPTAELFDVSGCICVPLNDRGEVLACVWGVDERVGWCGNYDFLLCRVASDGISLIGMRRVTEEEQQRVGEYQRSQPPSPQDLLMAGVCNDDESAAITGIDAALAAGANFTDEGVEPLSVAASAGRATVVKHLLARGATIGAEWVNNADSGADRPYGDTALHAAAERGDTQVLRLLLDADGKRFLETYGMLSGWRATPLGVAAKFGHLNACRVLIDAGADVNAHDELSIGETPLSEAVQNQHADVVRLLLAAGADPDIPGWMQVSARERAGRGDAGDEIRLLI
jgi:hypothetical protein